METSNYDQQTINSRNPLARYAHRTRVKRSVQLATPRVGLGKIMDYGCGSGVFLSKMNSIREGAAVGYEPYMTERAVDGLADLRGLRGSGKAWALPHGDIV
jgi:hypothetical protein